MLVMKKEQAKRENDKLILEMMDEPTDDEEVIRQRETVQRTLGVHSRITRPARRRKSTDQNLQPRSLR